MLAVIALLVLMLVDLGISIWALFNLGRSDVQD